MSLAAAFAKKSPATVAVVAVPAVVPAKAPEAAEPVAGTKRKRAASNASGEVERDVPAKVARDSDAKDISANRGKTRKERAEERKKPKDTLERLARTVFVGNVPLATTAKALGRFFQDAIDSAKGAKDDGAAAKDPEVADKDDTTAEEAGKSAGKPNKHLFANVESVRFRSIPITAVAVAPGSDYKQMAKAAYIKGSLDTDNSSSMHAYVVLTSPEYLDTVLSLNGKVFEGHHLRVDRTDKEVKYDPKRTIFVGNLPFDCADEDLRAVFAEGITGGDDCVESVRIVRDKLTKQCKGIAFVLFKERSHVAEALGLKDKALKGRPLRITRCSADGSAVAPGKKPHINRTETGKPLPKFMGMKGDDKVKRHQEKKAARKHFDKGGKPFRRDSTHSKPQHTDAKSDKKAPHSNEKPRFKKPATADHHGKPKFSPKKVSGSDKKTEKKRA